MSNSSLKFKQRLSISADSLRKKLGIPDDVEVLSVELNFEPHCNEDYTIDLVLSSPTEHPNFYRVSYGAVLPTTLFRD